MSERPKANEESHGFIVRFGSTVLPGYGGTLTSAINNARGRGAGPRLPAARAGPMREGLTAETLEGWRLRPAYAVMQ